MSSQISSKNALPASDPYLALNIPRSAGEGEIKRAYFTLVRQYPPETEPLRFQEIRAAYEQLRDPETRATTDLFLVQPPPPLPSRRGPKYDLDVQRDDLVALMAALLARPIQEDV